MWDIKANGLNVLTIRNKKIYTHYINSCRHLTNPLNYDRLSNNSFQKDNINTAYSTYYSLNEPSNLSNYEKYKNQSLLNRANSPGSSCTCICHTNPNIASLCQNCQLHGFHIHHIHVPIRQIYGG